MSQTRRGPRKNLSLAQEASRAVGGRREPSWLAVLGAEHANSRTALSWARDSYQPVLGLEISPAL